MENPENTGLITVLARNRKPVAYALCLAALGVAGLTFWLGKVVFPAANIPIVIWGGGVTFALLVLGLVQLLVEPDQEEESALRAQRIAVLAAGVAIGLITTLASLLFAWVWWSDLLTWLDVAGERKNGGGVLLMAVTLVVGLALMFFSLLLARAEERSSVGLRRLLYGYNAFLTGLLLAFNLVILNLLVTARASEPIDFTSKGLYTLSQTSQNTLRGLKSEVTVIALLENAGREGGINLYDLTRQLFRNCSERSPQFKGVVHDLTSLNDIAEIQEVQQKYPAVSDLSGIRSGILIVYNQGGQEQSRFIKETDLIAREGRGGAYKGEDALMTHLQFLLDEQRKPVVYFTQGNGEPDLKNAAENVPAGLGQVRQRLEKWNYEVKALTFSPLDAKVPLDADVLVMAGPRNTIPDHAVKAIREYLARQGKLVLMLDLIVEKEGTVRPSGLEALLTENGVRMPPERVLVRSNQPTLLPLQLSKGSPLGENFKGEPQFIMNQARPVERAEGPPRQRVETLLATHSQIPALRDKELQLGATQVLRNLERDIEVARKTYTTAVPVAVTVSSMSMDPTNPHAHMMPGMPPMGEQKPRMVVFGSSSMVANPFVSERVPIDNFDLVRGALEWLRERQATIGISPKGQNNYALSPTDSRWRLILLPAGMVMLTLAGLGASVWLVRRR